MTTLLQILGSSGTQNTILENFLYSSIIFNLGATTSAVLCLFILSNLTSRAHSIAATDANSLPGRILLSDSVSSLEDSERELLRKFGLGWSWSAAKDIMIFCFVLGTVCTFLGMGFWVWLRCVRQVAFVVTLCLIVVGGASGFVLMLIMTGN